MQHWTGIFCVLFLLMSSAWCLNPCERKAEPPFLDSAMFLNQSCYFTVINATESSTVLEWSLFRFEYVFNMTNAREVCAQYGATLPIINGEEENRFVSSYEAHEFTDEWGEKKVFRIALGMSRNPTTNTYEWDDGTTVTYEPSQGWERKHWPSRDCATLRRQESEPIWLSFPCHGVGIGRLGVLCKQVISPDCQYTFRPSNSCSWDESGKGCYEMAQPEILAPPLKGGKPCPESGIRRACPCKEKEKSDWQKDESRSVTGSGCGTKTGQSQGESCALVADHKESGHNGNGKAKTGAFMTFVTFGLFLRGVFKL